MGIILNGGNQSVNLICTVYCIADNIKVPLTLLAILFIGITKIGGAFFPRASQQAGEWLRGVVMGVLLVVGASWITSLLFEDETVDTCTCSAIRLITPVIVWLTTSPGLA